MAGNKKMLEKSPIDENTHSPTVYWAMRNDIMHSLGIGTTRKMNSVITGIFSPIMKSSEYILRENINLWRYKFFSKIVKKLQNKMYETDLTNEVPKLDILVYFCHGIYDYTISYKLTLEYFDKLQAPVKGFYTFNESYV